MNMHQWNILHKYVSCVGFSPNVSIFPPTSYDKPNDGTDIVETPSANIGDDPRSQLPWPSWTLDLLLSDNCAEIDWNPASNTILDSSNINVNVQLINTIWITHTIVCNINSLNAK